MCLLSGIMWSVDNLSLPPEQITPHQQTLILEAINAKGAVRPCYRCGNPGHSVHNSLTNLMLAGATNNIVFGGTTVPAAIVFCNNCGLVSMHALGGLGLLNHPAFGFEVAAQ